MIHTTLGRWRAGGTIAVAALLAFAATANATVYTATTGDELVQSVADANLNAGADTIVIPAGTEVAPLSPMTISDDLAITTDHSSQNANVPHLNGSGVEPITTPMFTINAGVKVNFDGLGVGSAGSAATPAFQSNGAILRFDGMAFAGQNGRGIVAGGSGASTTIANTTMDSNNFVPITQSAGTLTIDNSTLTDNFPNAVSAAGTVVRINNSIIHNKAVGGGDCSGASAVAATVVASIDGNGSCGTAATFPSHGLQDLGQTGGPTSTRMPLAGSPVINAGSDSACTTTDQRFFVRRLGATGQCDIGAYELGAALDTTLPTCTVTAVRAGPPKQQDVTLRDPESGLGYDAVRREEVTIENGTVAFSTFPSPFRSPTGPSPSNDGLVLTASKTDQGLSTRWSFTARDWAGNVRNCA